MSKAAKWRKWLETQKKFKLSDKHAQMARQVGLNPNKLGNLKDDKQQPWKAPLPEIIETIYFRHYGKKEPDVLRPPLKELLAAVEAKKRQQKESHAPASA